MTRGLLYWKPFFAMSNISRVIAIQRNFCFILEPYCFSKFNPLDFFSSVFFEELWEFGNIENLVLLKIVSFFSFGPLNKLLLFKWLMTSLLMTSQTRFRVLRRAGETSMGIFLNYTSSTHIEQSVCNKSEIANRKTQLQFENIYRQGLPFLDQDFSKIQNVISPLIFEIWTDGFQLLTPLALLFLKKYKKSWHFIKKLLIKVLGGRH